MKKFLLILLLSVFAGSVFAQTRTITGTILSSDKNEPLVGVTVQVKGNSTAAQTDVNGRYSIKITNLQNVVLTIKYVGYTYQEHTLKVGENNLDVKLLPSTETNLDDVVVVGYGTQKKVTLTGSVSVADLKKIEDVPALSLSAALRGTAVGVSVSGGVSRPGQSASIVVRNPIYVSKDPAQGLNPLYVIDDIVRSQADFEILDQSQVESISILKDAEASIYGVSGSNGVVIVRTKRGRAGAPKISFSSSVGFSNATQLPSVLSGPQLAQFTNDYVNTNLAQSTATATAGSQVFPDATKYYVDPVTGLRVLNGVTQTTKETSFYTNDELAYINNPDNNYNYMKQAFQTARIFREALSISGGSEKATYFVGGDYVNQGSNFSGVNSSKYGLRANIEVKPAKGLTVFASLSTDVNYSKNFWYKLPSVTESLDLDVTSLQLVYPWWKYYIDGNPVFRSTSGHQSVNFFLQQNSGNFTTTQNYLMNMLGRINYEVAGVKGLSVTATLNRNIAAANGKQFGTKLAYTRYSGEGVNLHIPGGTLQDRVLITNGDKVRLTPSFNTSYQLDAGLNYNRSFGKHNIAALALFEQRETNVDGVAAEAAGTITGGLPYQAFTTGAQTSNETASEYGQQSFISRLNYDYDNKYLLQLVYRADGSSFFGSENKWGSFPSASVGWVISSEPFFKKNVQWVDLFKFRASVGLTGSNQTKAFNYQASYNYGTGSGGGAVIGGAGDNPRTIGYKANLAIPNPGVAWDHWTKVDYGFDAQFLKNRLSFSADYFWSHGYDLLTQLTSSVPFVIGAATPSENYDIINTFGVELQAGWRDHIGKNFIYSFTPFFSWSDNKFVLYDIAAGNRGGPLDFTGGSNDPGVYGYKSLGMVRTVAEAQALIAQRTQAYAAAKGIQPSAVPANAITSVGNLIQPGMLVYQDTNNDGVITEADKTYFGGKQNNHYALGLNWSAGYAGVTLNVVMGASWGGLADVGGEKPTASSGTSTAVTDNRASYWADHYTPSNPNAKYPAAYFSSNLETSDFWFVSATQFNITNATLSYSLPTNWSRKAGMSSVRVFAVATNPIQFINPFPNNYRDFSSALAAYPALRTISLGLNVGF